MLLAQSTKIHLESATIYLERVYDGSEVTYTISDKAGNLNSKKFT